MVTANARENTNSEAEESKQIQEVTEKADVTAEEDTNKKIKLILEGINDKAEKEKKTVKPSSISDNPFLSKLNLQPISTSNNSSQIKNIQKEIQRSTSQSVKKMEELNPNRNRSLLPSSVSLKQTTVKNTGTVKSKIINVTDKVLESKKKNSKVHKDAKGAKSMAFKIQNKIKKPEVGRSVKIIKGKKNPKSRDTKSEASERNSDFLRTYNMMKIQNPKLLASRAAKLNLVKQTLLNIENEKTSKSSSKDKIERRCDDCGTPLCSGRDFIMHRDKCEVRQKRLEKILSGLKLPKSLQNTPQKEDSAHTLPSVPASIITNLSEIFDSNEEDAQSATETDNVIQVTQLRANKPLGTPSKSNKSPFRTLYNLYDGLNKEHIDIILNASRNERTLRSRAQESDLKSERRSKNFRKNFEIDNSQNEIIITTRIRGNVIERNTLIRPVQSEPEETAALSVDSSTVDEGQVNSRNMYETLKNNCQIPEPVPCIQGDLDTPQPRRELISDCPQGLPRSANIRKLLKRNVLNPIRRKSSILQESKKSKLERRNSLVEKAKMKISRKRAKLEKITSLLNDIIESPNVKKSTFDKKKKFVQECQKDFKSSWQIEETDKRQERAMRATTRSGRKLENKGNEGQISDTLDEMQIGTNQVQVEIIQSNAQIVKSPEVQPKEERVSNSGNLFVPYDFVLTTPVPDKVQKTYSETHNFSLSTKKNTEASAKTPIITSDVRNKTPQEVMSLIAEDTRQPTPIPRIAVVPSKRNTPGTPRSLEQILLKQEIMEELKKLESRKWCDVCKKPFANSSSLNLHFTSVAHKKRVESSLFGGSQGGNQLKMTANVEKKVRRIKKEVEEEIEATPETSEDDEEIENMCCEDEEETVELSEDEKQEAIVQEKAKRGRPRLTLSSSSENTAHSSVKRTRRSSTLILEQTLAESNETLQKENNETPQSKSNKTCATCNVSFPSDVQLNRHYSSKMHKTAAVLVADGKPKVCSVCKVSFSVNSQLHKHYATQTHKMAAAKLVNQLEERGVIKTALFT